MNAKVCDMCGTIIWKKYEPMPRARVRYLITIQEVSIFRSETKTVDLCQNCYESICEINRKKNEEQI